MLPAVVAVALLISVPSTAQAKAAFQPCGMHGRLACAVVTAPLDPSGHAPGHVSLAALRFEQTGTDKAGTVVAIAGGPGQSAIEAFPSFVHTLAPILRDRALVVFDPRGVGLSGPLECGALSSLSRCARRLGAKRAFYTTVDSVSDLEAVRQALNVERVGLVGVSYGTFLGLGYAQAHPEHVDRLVLDSTVPADGEPALGLNTVAAMRAFLQTMCATACPSLNPLADVQTMLANLTRKPVHFDNGYSHVTVTATLAGETIYEALVDSDLDPFLRATLPAALHLIAAGDLSALGRLQSLAFASAGSAMRTSAAVKHRRPPQPQIDVEGIATTCEDTRWPWATSDAQSVRAARTRDLFGAIAPDAMAPFNRKTIFAASPFADCERWPEAGNGPARAAGPLPSIPTLVLSGRDDIRTPTTDAAALVGSLPSATLVTVPNVGHSVLGSDSSGCAERALSALFDGQPIGQCAPAQPASIDPLPPDSVSTLTGAGGLAGTRGQVLTGAVLTLRHDVGFALQALTLAPEIEGTRGGYLVVRGSGRSTAVVLHGVSYVPGVALTGSLNLGSSSRFALGTLAVSHNGRRYGMLTLTRSGAIRGRLGGRRVRLSLQLRERILAAGGLTPTPGTIKASGASGAHASAHDARI